MYLRSNALTVAVAGFAVIGGLFAAGELSSQESIAIVQPASAAEVAPAIATYKIAAADVMAAPASGGSLTDY